MAARGGLGPRNMAQEEGFMQPWRRIAIARTIMRSLTDDLRQCESRSLNATVHQSRRCGNG